MKLAIIFLLIALSLTKDASYSESLSGKMIQLSTAIYNITKANQAANVCPDCYKGFTVLRQILGNKILALIGVDRSMESVIVVFRGSDNLRNWLTDANIIMSSYDQDKTGCKKCKVHKGFKNSYKRLTNQNIRTAIKQVVDSNPTFDIIFTGHSLGGAVANLAAATYKLQYPKAEVSLYTYGQPRVGNSLYSQYVNRLLPVNFRVIHRKDIVPHKPAYYAFYRHSGTEIWYKDGMREKYVQCKGESNSCSNGLGSRNINFSTKDHSSSNYVLLFSKNRPNGGQVREEVPLTPKAIAKEDRASIEEGEFEDDQNDLFEGHDDQL